MLNLSIIKLTQVHKLYMSWNKNVPCGLMYDV